MRGEALVSVRRSSEWSWCLTGMGSNGVVSNRQRKARAGPRSTGSSPGNGGCEASPPPPGLCAWAGYPLSTLREGLSGNRMLPTAPRSDVDHPHTGISFAHSAAQGGRSGGLVILSSCHSVMVAGGPEKGAKVAQIGHDRTSSSVIAPRFPKIKGVATNFAPNGMTERPHPVMGSGVPKKR